MRRSLFAFIALFAIALPASAQTAGYYRQPSIHGNTIVFVAEGDLWKTDVNGSGVAVRLTTNLAEETNPAISPDGRTIAFTGRFDGQADVYTMPLTGGSPQRHTWDTGVTVQGWTNDGRIIYTTRRYSTLPNNQLLFVDPKNNDRELVKLAQAWDGAFHGKDLLFTRLPWQGSHTKRYKGGTAQQIWRWAVGGGREAVNITGDFAGTSKSPRVHGERVFFLSDRDNIMNVWSMDANGKNLVQHTMHKDYDVRDFALQNGRIVYAQGADLWLLDVGPMTTAVLAKASGEPRKLNVLIASDHEQLRDRWVKKPMDFLSDWHVDYTGDRVALVARGVAFVAPVNVGRFVQIPNNGGVRFREARFSRDGKNLSVLSDLSGEIEIWNVPADGSGRGEQLTRDADILRWDIIPSPDGKLLAHHDKNNKLYITDVASKSTKHIGTGKTAGMSSVRWSADGKKLAYVTPVSNANQVIWMYDVASGATSQITSDRYDSWDAAFTPDGNWMYFLSDRTFNTSVGSPWGSRQPEPYYNNQTKIYAIALKPNLKFPFAQKTEFDGDSTAASRAPVLAPAHALYEVPVSAGNYSNLQTDGKRLYLNARDERYSGGNPRVASVEIKNDDAKIETFQEGVGYFELTGDQKKIAFRKGDDLYVVPAGAKAPTDLTKNKVDLSAWLLPLERKEEFKGLFADAWRLHRDYFYDPGMHGVDWKKMREKYSPLAERVADRSELNDVIAQMVGELSALHTYVAGGDTRGGADTIPHASLGAVLEKGSDGWRVAKIYRNDPEVPTGLSPLAMPGVGVSEGDVILAINGVPLSSVDHPVELLYGKAGKQVLLRVRAGAGAGARERDVIVYPITLGAEQSLRYSDWQYSRRLLVDSLSGGKIGYVHLRAMGGGNMNEFVRDFYPVHNRQALIVDMRNNSGGNIDSWVLSKLQRKAWMWWSNRAGEPYKNMQYAFTGPMVTLVNEWSASDGEAFPEGFRRLGLGRIIGTRTWGGEIWLTSSNSLADRGIATAAEFGVFSPEGEWLIEGHGVEPDIVVDNNPVSAFSGDDAQLRRAVEEMMNELKVKPVRVPAVPKYPRK
jgi:tricorn protease